MTRDLSNLLDEYRPSMTLDVLHAWAADVVAVLSPSLPPDHVTYTIKQDEEYLLSGTGPLWEVRVVNSLDEFDWCDLEVRAASQEEADTKAETVARRNADFYFGGPSEPHYYAERSSTHVVEDAEDEEPDLNDDADRFYGPGDWHETH